jgi:hypothetical protein
LKLFQLTAAILGILLGTGYLCAQDADTSPSEAGYVPILSGGMGYIHNVNGGITALEPQINPVLLVPFGSHVLLEARASFFGFFQRQNGTSGPFKGKVFNSVDYAQVDWLANTHVMATVGKYLLPFGLYNERLDVLWIRNLQDPPINAAIGTLTSGAGDGIMLRGVLSQTSSRTIQYSSYFSALCTIRKLEAARTAGGDGSVFLTNIGLEIGGSYQRFLQDRHINSAAAYLAWHPPGSGFDLKLEYDGSHNGNGYWLESAYLLDQMPIAQAFFKKLQVVGRVEQFFPLNGGGNALPTVDTNRFDVGLNYYLRDDLRIISSYGRQFSSQGNANIWNAGLTYRFMLPLWPGKR